MRGSVRKRGESWRARYRDDSGHEHQRTFARKGEADGWLRTQLHAVASGTHVDPSAGSITFAEYAQSWMGSQHVRPNTRRQIEARLRLYVSPVVGTIALRSIRRSHGVEVVRRCSVDLGLSPLVVKHALATLRAVMESALRDQLVPRNVVADPTITLPKRERTTDVLTPEQVAAIAEAMVPRLRAAVVLGASSGLRPGELVALTLDHVVGLADALSDGEVVDLTARRERVGQVTLRVDRQLVGRRFAPTKTGSSNRSVPISPSTVAALVEHVQRFGVGSDALLFTSEVGTALDASQLSRAWARATKGMELPGGSWHLLRHHHASSLLSQGINVAAVSKRLGHGSPAITLSTYAHAMPSDEQRVLDASEAIALAVGGA